MPVRQLRTAPVCRTGNNSIAHKSGGALIPACAGLRLCVLLLSVLCPNC